MGRKQGFTSTSTLYLYQVRPPIFFGHRIHIKKLNGEKLFFLSRARPPVLCSGGELFVVETEKKVISFSRGNDGIRS